jgi:predicted ferric reductase
MIAALPVIGGSNSQVLWYATRTTGLAAMVLLTGTLVLGIVSSVGWASKRWPRFASQTLHRNLSLVAVAFVALHVVTTLADNFVPMHLVDAFVPFASSYRPLWVGLGAISLDLLLAILITSAVRHRIGHRSWRLVHWTAYACWPIAFAHGLGIGTDQRLKLVLLLDAACAAAVAGAVVWRLLAGRHQPVGHAVGPDRVAGASRLSVRSRGGAPW